MDELRVVRRDNQSLIVANESGEEFRLLIDDSALAEIRHLSRPSGEKRVSPREIQSLVRAGKSRAEIIELTGADEFDIDRYEEPVLAERRHILASAQRIPVRTTPAEDSNEQFGQVIAERLIGLSATAVEWTSWRDEEAGWMIGLDFVSQSTSHHAVWSFDHKRSLLSPLTPDAVNLSKQGEVGDRLIPKLRAVDPGETGRFDSGSFNTQQLVEAPDVEPLEDDNTPDASDPAAQAAQDRPQLSAATEAALKAGHPSTGSIPIIDPENEFDRRKAIDRRAIKTSEPRTPELGETADLLDALRKRRGDRALGEPAASPIDPSDDFPNPVPIHGDHTPPQQTRLPNDASEGTPDQSKGDTAETSAADTTEPTPKQRGKGRSPIPSWDDILFGTRGDDDPTSA